MTISVDEETARWARMEAARQETSVSRLVGNLLREHMLQQMGYDKAMADFLGRPSQRLKKRGRTYPSRADLHNRG